MESKICKHIAECVKLRRLEEHIISRGLDSEHLRIIQQEYCSQRGIGCMPEIPRKYNGVVYY